MPLDIGLGDVKTEQAQEQESLEAFDKSATTYLALGTL